MPKVLNVEKLENKFQNLSRSKESIQGLSTWIMHHKEVYQEIVEHWLNTISKNCNTLAMLYVANEVIQGCGKKKCPEFREAFSKVLDEAVSYEHVKEIKDKIFRLLNIWKERKLYDDEFYQRIEEKLNSEEKEESSEESEEEELSEQKIIEKFKKQSLIDEWKKLNSVELKRKEKEDILNYADVPELTNLDEVIVRMDCQDTVKKCNAYITLVQDFTNLLSKEISLRKKLLKELKNNCVFYSAQQKDVICVANAFRIYGKRVEIVEARLAEKIKTFSLPSDSPCFSEDMTLSPNPSVSFDADDASKYTPSPINEFNQNSCSSANSWKDGLFFSGKVSTGSVSENVEQPSQGRSMEESMIPDFPNLNFSKITELIEETKSQKGFTYDKHLKNFSEITKTTFEEKNSNIIQDPTNIYVETISDIPLKQINFTEEIKNSEAKDTKQIPDKKKNFSEKEPTRLLNKEVVSNTDLENQAEKTLVKFNSILPIQQTCIIEQKKQSDSNPNESQAQGNEAVDFLLDKSFDEKSKTKLNYKRKIEFLLKTKGKKHCSVQHSQDLSEKVSPKHEIKNDDTDKINAHSKDIEMSKDKNKKSVSKIVEGAEKRNSKCLVTQSEIDVIESVSDNVKHCDKSFNVNNNNAGSKLCFNDEIQSEKETFPFNQSGTFTGTSLSSFMSNFPTGMCFEDLKQIKKEILPFNPCDTFTRAAFMSTNMCSEDTKQPEKETLPFSQSGTFIGTVLSSDMCSEVTKQLEKETSPFDPCSTFTGNTMFPVSSMCSEDPEQLKKDTLPFNPSNTFTGTALSFMSGMSTDFLKNILQKNQQNTQTKTNDESYNKTSEISSDGEFNSPVKKASSNIPYNLTNNDTRNEECSIKDCVNSISVSQANFEEILPTSETDTNTEINKTKSQVSLHNTIMELPEPFPDTASKSVNLDKPNSSLSATKVGGILSSNNSKQADLSENLKLSNNDEVLNKKSNLMETLKNILACLSENMQSSCDLRTSTAEEYKELEPPLPIESMLKIYNYLHGEDDNFINNNSSCLEISSNTSNTNTVSVANASADNNYEVMDMDCDSGDEII